MLTRSRASSAFRAAQLGKSASRTIASLTRVGAVSTSAFLPRHRVSRNARGPKPKPDGSQPHPDRRAQSRATTESPRLHTSRQQLFICNVGQDTRREMWPGLATCRKSGNIGLAMPTKNRRAHAVTMRLYLVLVPSKTRIKIVNGVTGTQIASRASRILPIMRTKASTRALPVTPLVPLS